MDAYHLQDRARMKTPPRRLARPVQLEDILSSAFQPNPASLLDPTLRGHLTIEALLIELIQLRRLDDKVYRMSFPDKAEHLAKEGLIHGGLRDALIAFNEWRNDFAHVFAHQARFADVHDLAAELEGYGVDFSGSVGSQPAVEASENYDGDKGVLAEILWCLGFEVAHALVEAGGRDLFAA
jgi:hypothetical protein